MPNGNTPQQPPRIIINTTNEALIGKYTNLIMVSFDQEGFYMDCNYVKFPPNGILIDRLVLSPAHTKRLSDLLQKKIQEYEKQYKTEVKPPESLEPEIGGFHPDK